MTKKLSIAALTCLLFSSCPSTTEVTVTNDESARRIGGGGVSLKPKADKFRMAEIVKSKMPIYVRNTGEVSNLAGDLKRKLEGRLAEQNFIINNTRNDHFLIVNLSVESGSSNRGNYHKYYADVNVNLKRKDSRNLGDKDFEIIGDRKEGSTAALKSLTNKIGTDITDWVADQADEARVGLVASELSVDIGNFRDASDAKLRSLSSAFSVNSFTSKAKALKGIFDCQLIETRGDVYNFRIIYMEKHFPNGLTGRSIYSDNIAVDKDDPLGSLVDVIFSSAQ